MFIVLVDSNQQTGNSVDPAPLLRPYFETAGTATDLKVFKIRLLPLFFFPKDGVPAWWIQSKSFACN